MQAQGEDENLPLEEGECGLEIPYGDVQGEVEKIEGESVASLTSHSQEEIHGPWMGGNLVVAVEREGERGHHSVVRENQNIGSN